MEFSFLILAESALLTNNGKFYIWGACNFILAPVFPYIHPPSVVVGQVISELGEDPGRYTCTLRILDEDGRELGSREISLEFERQATGRPMTGRFIVPLIPIRFHAPGTYEFGVYVNDELQKSTSLHIIAANS